MLKERDNALASTATAVKEAETKHALVDAEKGRIVAETAAQEAKLQAQREIAEARKRADAADLVAAEIAGRSVSVNLHNTAPAQAPVPFSVPAPAQQVIRIESGAGAGGNAMGSLDFKALMALYAKKAGEDAAKLPAGSRQQQAVLDYKAAYEAAASGSSLTPDQVGKIRETAQRKQTEGTASGAREAQQLLAAIAGK